jgi:hypothetical protein
MQGGIRAFPPFSHFSSKSREKDGARIYSALFAKKPYKHCCVKISIANP